MRLSARRDQQMLINFIDRHESASENCIVSRHQATNAGGCKAIEWILPPNYCWCVASDKLTPLHLSKTITLPQLTTTSSAEKRVYESLLSSHGRQQICLETLQSRPGCGCSAQTWCTGQNKEEATAGYLRAFCEVSNNNCISRTSLQFWFALALFLSSLWKTPDPSNGALTSRRHWLTRTASTWMFHRDGWSQAPSSVE